MSLDRPLCLRAILSYLPRFFGPVSGEYYNLRVEYSKYNRRIFLYSETLKLHQFRRNVLAENYNEVILNEKKLIIKELENFEHQKKFLDELYLKYPELAPQFFKLKNKLTSNQQYSDAKLRAIDGLIELF